MLSRLVDILSNPEHPRDREDIVNIAFIFTVRALVSTGLLKRELRAEGLVGLVKKPENNKC